MGIHNDRLTICLQRGSGDIKNNMVEKSKRTTRGKIG